MPGTFYPCSRNVLFRFLQCAVCVGLPVETFLKLQLVQKAGSSHSFDWHLLTHIASCPTSFERSSLAACSFLGPVQRAGAKWLGTQESEGPPPPMPSCLHLKINNGCLSQHIPFIRNYSCFSKGKCLYGVTCVLQGGMPDTNFVVLELPDKFSVF